MTRYQLHCHTWKDGCGSDFCEGARKVLYRGDIPCDILFCGEAPGKSENSAGIPFHPGAPAGKLLMYIVKRSVPASRPHVRIPVGPPGCDDKPLTGCANCHEYEAGLDNPCTATYRIGYTNIVSCIPRDPDSTDKLTDPPLEQIASCKPRLEEIISIANPKLIVAVGQVAKACLTSGYMSSTKLPPNCAVVHIHHPAFILRQTTAFQGLEVQRCCITIKDAIHALENPAPVPPPPREKARFRLSTDRKATTQQSDYGIVPPVVDRPSWDTNDIPF